MRPRFLLAGLVTALFLNTSPAHAQAGQVPPSVRTELEKVREDVWVAWFNNDQKRMNDIIAPELIAISADDDNWQTKPGTMQNAAGFVQGGGKLIKVEFPHTDIQLYGDVAILYSRYIVAKMKAAGTNDPNAGFLKESADEWVPQNFVKGRKQLRRRYFMGA